MYTCLCVLLNKAKEQNIPIYNLHDTMFLNTCSRSGGEVKSCCLYYKGVMNPPHGHRLRRFSGYTGHVYRSD